MWFSSQYRGGSRFLSLSMPLSFCNHVCDSIAARGACMSLQDLRTHITSRRLAATGNCSPWLQVHRATSTWPFKNQHSAPHPIFRWVHQYDIIPVLTVTICSSSAACTSHRALAAQADLLTLHVDDLCVDPPPHCYSSTVNSQALVILHHFLCLNKVSSVPKHRRSRTE